ncbi:MAG: transporter [Vampirovibrionales bacterium]|nr:transporter [Vampirovibrionales bacterium]
MKKSLLILSLALLALPAYAAEPLSDPTKELTVDLSSVELPKRQVFISQDSDNNDAGPLAPPNNASVEVAIPNISTSRPSFTDAVTTVPQGSVQGENGATYTDNRGGSYSWTTPETLLRLGITDNTELRFTTPNYTYIGDNRPGSLSNNFGDISVGLSHHLVAPGKIDVALIPILNIPSGANKVSTNSVDPQFRLVVAKALTSKWLISSHLDTRWNTGRNASAEVVFNPTFINYYSFTKNSLGF